MKAVKKRKVGRPIKKIVPKKLKRIEYNSKIKATDDISGLSDNDLKSIEQVVSPEMRSIRLSSEQIKTLPNDIVVNLIEERRSELKELKIELISRIV